MAVQRTARKPARGPDGPARAGQEPPLRTRTPHVPVRPGDSARADGVGMLQRYVGNQALQRAVRSGDLVVDGRPVQASLRVGPANDVYEQEADAVARQVLDETGEQETAQGTPPVQRAPAVSAGWSEEPGAGLEGGAAGAAFEQSLQASRGGGQSLPGDSLERMSSGFGTDFSDVRIHTDSRADALNRSINADAFTHGRDIFFRQGAYDPQSAQGQHTLAHELTHVVQQTGGGGAGVQRLISAAQFRKDTKLFGRKGKSGNVIGQITQMLSAYQGPLQAQSVSTRLQHLGNLLAVIKNWLNSNQSNKSSRRADVFRLQTEVGNEITALQQNVSDIQPGDFADVNVATANDQAFGGQMNSLDELTMNFGVEEFNGQMKKTADGSFTGLFKEDVAVDQFPQQHRGDWTRIPRNNPQYAKRALAMYEVDKLLDARVIPPTFTAQHNNKQGIIMKKIEGITGQDAMTAGNQQALTDPKVRQGLSKLYLLDILCGQVDRHHGNYIIEQEGGVIKGVWGIDNDLSFGEGYDSAYYDTAETNKNFIAMMRSVNGQLLSQLNEIDKAFAQRIVNLAATPNVLTTALQGLISANEAQAMLQRLTKLANFLQPLLNNNDPKLKTQWQ